MYLQDRGRALHASLNCLELCLSLDCMKSPVNEHFKLQITNRHRKLRNKVVYSRALLYATELHHSFVFHLIISHAKTIPPNRPSYTFGVNLLNISSLAIRLPFLFV